MDPLNIITSTMSLVDAVSTVNIKGLPYEFAKVEDCLPVVQNSLSLAQQYAQRHKEVCAAIIPVISNCHDKAQTLKYIFDHVQVKSRSNGSHGDGESLLDRYRLVLRQMGKESRVETLMQALLADLKVVDLNQKFRAAVISGGQQAKLTELEADIAAAIETLASIESPVSDPELDGCLQIKQSIANGATGNQLVNTGKGTSKANFGGNSFDSGGGSMNFVMPQNEEDRRNRILRSLETSPYLTRKNRNPDPVPGTCCWFVEHRLFRSWLHDGTASNMLWVSADPGCGKSVLAKHLVDHVLRAVPNRTICYFFFKDDFEDQKTAWSALGNILHQLFTQRPELFNDALVRRFETSPQLTNSVDDLWNVLVLAAQDPQAGEIICVLDALDDCERNELEKLSVLLRKFLTASNNGGIGGKGLCCLKFLVTSRPYDHIRRNLRPECIPIIHLKGETEEETAKIAAEIDLYIGKRVDDLAVMKDLTAEEKQLLLTEIRRTPNRTYLWVYLTLDWIEKEIDINTETISKISSSFPRSVYEAYNSILSKSPAQRQEIQTLLQIVVAATKPFTLKEMDVALALRAAHKSLEDLSLRGRRMGQYVRELCGLFLTIVDSKIYLLHQTAREFLVFNTPLRPDHLKWEGSVQLHEAHCSLYKICASYLLLDEFRGNPFPTDFAVSKGDLENYLKKHVFFQYAATNWVTHFRESGLNDDTVIDVLLGTPDSEPHWYSTVGTDSSSSEDSDDSDTSTAPEVAPTWFAIYWYITHHQYLEDDEVYSPLVSAAYFGFTRIVKKLLKQTDPIYSATLNGRNALSWAADHGHADVVKLLLKDPRIRFRNIKKFLFRKDSPANHQDESGRTPLSYAAWNGHADVVNLLLDAGARADIADYNDRTPIIYALCAGHRQIFNMLINGFAIGSEDEIMERTLLSAAEEDDSVLATRLLEQDVNVNVTDESGQTPLIYSCLHGNNDVSILLVKKGANVNATDKYKRTPLSYAASSGELDIVVLLLDNGATIDLADSRGRTPLSYAATRDNECAKELIQRCANVDAADNDNRTPLSYAASYDEPDIVVFLLDKGAAVDLADSKGRTPLSYAILRIRSECSKELIRRGANVDAADINGRTPLSYSAGWRYIWNDETANPLINAGATIDMADKYGRTPLSYACEHNNIPTIKQLLQKNANIEAADHLHRTPLWYSAKGGFWNDTPYCRETVKLLLENGAKVNAADEDGNTPLMMAAEKRRVFTIALLLENGADIHATNKKGQTAYDLSLEKYSQDGNFSALRLLIEKGIDIDTTGADGLTALEWATKRKDQSVITWLMEHGARKSHA